MTIGRSSSGEISNTTHKAQMVNYLDYYWSQYNKNFSTETGDGSGTIGVHGDNAVANQLWISEDSNFGVEFERHPVLPMSRIKYRPSETAEDGTEASSGFFHDYYEVDGEGTSDDSDGILRLDLSAFQVGNTFAENDPIEFETYVDGNLSTGWDLPSPLSRDTT